MGRVSKEREREKEKEGQLRQTDCDKKRRNRVVGNYGKHAHKKETKGEQKEVTTLLRCKKKKKIGQY